jgi:hypothetical protein
MTFSDSHWSTGIPEAGSVNAAPTMPWHAGTAAGPWGGATQPPWDADRRQCAMLLVRTYQWLESVISRAPDVKGLVPQVIRAVESYKAGDFGRCLSLMNGVAQAIAAARSLLAGLPPW